MVSRARRSPRSCRACRTSGPRRRRSSAPRRGASGGTRPVRASGSRRRRASSPTRVRLVVAAVSCDASRPSSRLPAREKGRDERVLGAPRNVRGTDARSRCSRHTAGPPRRSTASSPRSTTTTRCARSPSPRFPPALHGQGGDRDAASRARCAGGACARVQARAGSGHLVVARLLDPSRLPHIELSRGRFLRRRRAEQRSTRSLLHSAS